MIRINLALPALLSACLPALGGIGARAQDLVSQGEQIYQQECAQCHSLEPGVHRIGPSLANVVGQQAATVEGYDRYSSALKEADVVWDEQALNQWIEAPNAFIPGNRMAYPGLPDAQEREAVIAYLKANQQGQPPDQQQDAAAEEPADQQDAPATAQREPAPPSPPSAAEPSPAAPGTPDVRAAREALLKAQRTLLDLELALVTREPEQEQAAPADQAPEAAQAPANGQEPQIDVVTGIERDLSTETFETVIGRDAIPVERPR